MPIGFGGLTKMNKQIVALMTMQTKINDHLEFMGVDQFYAPSQFNLECWWNELEVIISALIASEEV